MSFLDFKSADASRLDFPCELKLATSGKDGEIEGYASVFGIMDRGGDIVMPKAFKESLTDWRRRKELPPMLWHHDPSNPIGVWTSIQEDEKGLKVTGELILDIAEGAAAYSRLKKGAVKGMSIGYRTKDYEIDRSTGARNLKKVELWEISLVTIPMLREAQITGVKSDFDAQNWERAFREEGLSIREAKIATSVARSQINRDGGSSDMSDPCDGVTDVLMALRKLSNSMRQN